jgi:hypothetical protein
MHLYDTGIFLQKNKKILLLKICKSWKEIILKWQKIMYLATNSFSLSVYKSTFLLHHLN